MSNGFSDEKICSLSALIVTAGQIEKKNTNFAQLFLSFYPLYNTNICFSLYTLNTLIYNTS
jgi:hypothetical protein